MSSSVVAALDLGSNTLELVVFEASPDREPRLVLADERIPRISAGVERRGRLDPEAERRTLDALIELGAVARAKNAERIEGVATAGLRGVPREEAGAFLRRAEQASGVAVRLIDGEEEAALAFRSTALRFPGPRWSLDVGGRSTELAFGTGVAPAWSRSFDVGGVGLAERFRPSDPPEPAQLDAIRTHIRQILAPLGAAPPSPGAPVVGVSGTALAALGLERNEPNAHRLLALPADRSKLPLSSLRAHRARLATLPATDRVYGSVLPARRADVVVLGLLILEVALERLGATALDTCPGGVAAGLAAVLLDGTAS